MLYIKYALHRGYLKFHEHFRSPTPLPAYCFLSKKVVNLVHGIHTFLNQPLWTNSCGNDIAFLQSGPDNIPGAPFGGSLVTRGRITLKSR